MRWTSSRARIERVEVLVRKDHASSLSQCREKALFIEKVLADDVDRGEGDLFFSGSSH